MSKLSRSVLISGLMIAGGFAPSVWAHHDSDSLPLVETDKADVCAPGTQQIRVTVKGAQHQGLVKVELYKPEDKFLKDETRKVRVPAHNEPFQVCINLDAPGTYAIAGYNDLDADRKLDKTWKFRPKEPFGVVNQHRLKKKKRPKFEQISFEVGATGVDVDLILVDPKAD